MTTIEIRTQDMYEQLSKAERLAADYLLHNLDHIFRYPLATLAERSGTSQGAWVRFCKALGYDGIKSLKNALFKEMQDSASEHNSASEHRFVKIYNHSNLTSVAKYIATCSTIAIEDTLKLLDEETLENAINTIKKAGRIALFGIHASSLVANDLYTKFLRISYPAYYSPDYHVSLATAATLTPNDVAIVFSYSGETEEILRLAQTAHANAVPIIAITRPADNNLSKLADYTLRVISPQMDKRSGSMSARIALLAMADILFSTIIFQEYDNIEECLEQTYYACRPGEAW